MDSPVESPQLMRHSNVLLLNRLWAQDDAAMRD
jgi:hypothetical protein